MDQSEGRWKEGMIDHSRPHPSNRIQSDCEVVSESLRTEMDDRDDYVAGPTIYILLRPKI